MPAEDDCYEDDGGAVSACSLTPSPILSVKPLTPAATCPQLPASEIKQTFLSTNLAYLWAFEWRAARTPTRAFW